MGRELDLVIYTGIWVNDEHLNDQSMMGLNRWNYPIRCAENQLGCLHNKNEPFEFSKELLK
jgi:hypothetical protein